LRVYFGLKNIIERLFLNRDQTLPICGNQHTPFEHIGSFWLVDHQFLEIRPRHHHEVCLLARFKSVILISEYPCACVGCEFQQHLDLIISFVAQAVCQHADAVKHIHAGKPAPDIAHAIRPDATGVAPRGPAEKATQKPILWF